MYEVVNLTTKETKIFPSYRSAESYILANGGWDLFRVFPW